MIWNDAAKKLASLLDAATSAGPITNVAKTSRVVAEFPGDQSAKGGPYLGATQHSSLTASPGPLSKQARAELNAKVNPRPQPGELDGVPFPVMAQQRAFDSFLQGRGYQVPKGNVTQLGELDAPWLRLQAAIGEFAQTQNANAAYHANREDIAKRTAAGDTTVNQGDAWSRQDFLDDHRERLMALKNEAKRIEREAWPIAESALLAKAEFADAVADELEAEARKPFDEFCVPYRSPAYVLLLRKYALSLRNGSRSTVGRPSSMLADL
jgi:hypothetical protein